MLNIISIFLIRNMVVLGEKGELLTVQVVTQNRNSLKKSVFKQITDFFSTLFLAIAFVISFLSARTIMATLDEDDEDQDQY